MQRMRQPYRQRQQEDREREKLAAKEAAAEKEPKKLDLLQYLLVRDLPIFSKRSWCRLPY